MSIHLDPDKCIGCSACVVHCPVAQVTPKFLGPRLIGPAYERFRLLGFSDDPSLQYCANCKNCEIACPHNVPIATINMLARQEQCRETPPGLRDWIVAHGETLARLLKYVPACLKNMGVRLSLTRILLDCLGIARACPMPDFAEKAFRDHMRHFRQTPSRKKVVFFPGCYINYYDPGTGFDLVWILQHAGYEVIVPREFVCCGVPLISSGFSADARKNASANAEVLRKYDGLNIPVITACPSCRLMLSREMAELFPDLAATPPKILDAQDFLLGLMAKGELPAGPESGAAVSVLYHAPCHLRAQGEGLPGLELLRHFSSYSVTSANAGCCGISGSYGFKKEKYTIGQDVGARLFETVRKSSCDLVATECGTCRLQISGATGRTVVHPLTLVRAALEGTPLTLKQ